MILHNCLKIENSHGRKSSSIVRVYYPDPALATTTPGSKKSKKKIREDVIKIDYNNTECTDKFNCALHQTMLRTDDYLKSVLNTFNSVPNPIKKGKQIYTSYFDNAKEPYYLLWDNDKNLGKEKYNLESIKKSGGAKKIIQRKSINKHKIMYKNNDLYIIMNSFITQQNKQLLWNTLVKVPLFNKIEQSEKITWFETQINNIYNHNKNTHHSNNDLRTFNKDAITILINILKQIPKRNRHRLNK